MIHFLFDNSQLATREGVVIFIGFSYPVARICDRSDIIAARGKGGRDRCVDGQRPFRPRSQTTYIRCRYWEVIYHDDRVFGEID